VPVEINYTPPPTGKKFMESNAKMRVLMGPVGSGKSVTCSFEIIRRASMQAPNEQGVRRTRCIVVRETARQLEDTTIKTFMDWFPPGQCGYYLRTKKTYYLKVGDIECEIMFRALDDSDDVANLNSLEATFAWVNECRDIHPDIIDALSKRVGRFPSAKDGGPT
jgi:phage terminase large subunit